MIYKNKLYEGSVQMLFDSNRHRYTFNDEIIPTVTGILGIIAKPALINWSANTAVESIQSSIEPGKSYDEIELHTIFEAGRKAHFQKKVDAGNLGSFVHKWVEQYIKGENPTMPVNEELQDSIRRFLTWVEKKQDSWPPSRLCFPSDINMQGLLTLSVPEEGSRIFIWET